MVKRNKLPKEGELVVATVKEVKGFGAFADLDEYPGKDGFIHIAEVAAGWVKYVRDHVRENQKIVCKVISLDRSKGHVDLSLKRVNQHQRREKVAEWKNEAKAEKLLEILGERMGKTPQELLDAFAYDLVETYGSLYSAFEAAAIGGADELEADGHTGDWVGPLVELAAENIQIPFVSIHGFVDLESFSLDGVADIRAAVDEASDSEYEDVDVSVEYMGAPRYRVKVKAPDYKTAEEELKSAADRAIKVMTERGGTGEFSREAEEK